MVEVVDLPQPDSPTSPTLSPRSIEKLMPSTARNTSGSGVGPPRNSFDSDLVMPWRGYSLTSFSTTSSGSGLPLPLRRGRSRGCGTSAGATLPASSGSKSRSVTPGRGVARISLRV